MSRFLYKSPKTFLSTTPSYLYFLVNAVDMLGSSRHKVLLVPFRGGSRKSERDDRDTYQIQKPFIFLFNLFFTYFFRYWTLLLFQVDTYSHSWNMFPQHWTKYIENLDNLVTVTSNLLNIIMQQVGGTKISPNTVTGIQGYATRTETFLHAICCLSVPQLFIKSQTELVNTL